MKVLVVDDDDFVRTVIAQALKGAGYDVEESCDGGDAITKLGKSKYDIVITDVVMPKQSGASVGEYIKNHELPTAVLAISSYGGDGGALDFANYFSDDTLQKPFGKETLLKAIKRLPVGGDLDSALLNL
jgi:CheY-like chemotaxis protein